MMIFLPASAQSTSASFVCRVIYTHCYHFLISILLPIQCKRTSFPTDLPKSLPLRSLATFFISDFMDSSFISQQHLTQLATFLVLIFFPSAFGYCQTSQTLLVFFFLFWLLPLIFFQVSVSPILEVLVALKILSPSFLLFLYSLLYWSCQLYQVVFMSSLTTLMFNVF